MSRKYPLLNDKDWLQQKYVEEKLSTVQITPLVGAKTCNSVRQALIRHGIPVRSVSEGLTCNRKDDGFILNHDVLIGCLLGDGGLSKWNPVSEKSNPCFYKKNKYYDHVQYVGQQLMGDLWQTRYIPEYRLLNGKNLLYHRIDTLSHKELLPIYRDWYPQGNNFKKIVPIGFKLTPISILHWFMDDGSTSFRQDRDSIVMTLCSESFSQDENEYLCDLLNEFDLDARVKPANSGTGYRIGIKSSKLNDFFDLIGPCPVPNLVYKWKRPT